MSKKKTPSLKAKNRRMREALDYIAHYILPVFPLAEGRFVREETVLHLRETAQKALKP